VLTGILFFGMASDQDKISQEVDGAGGSGSFNTQKAASYRTVGFGALGIGLGALVAGTIWFVLDTPASTAASPQTPRLAVAPTLTASGGAAVVRATF
jgi:hypothetical protein